MARETWGPLSSAEQNQIELSDPSVSNAATATALETPRLINGVAFDGTADIVIPAGGSATVNVVDEASDSTCFPLFVTAATGTLETKTNSTLTFNSATGALASTSFTGALTGCTGLPVSTGISGLGSGVATFLATPSSANLAAAVTGETGSGALVFATSPVLVTPALGTPSSGNLANCTFPTLNQSTSGNAATATALQTARAINGTNFDGTAAITVTAAAGTLTGTTLNSSVVTSSLTAVGTITTGVWNGTDIALANIAAASGASKLLGRGSSGGAGDFQELTLGTGLSLSGTVLSAAAASTIFVGAAEMIPRTTSGAGVGSYETTTNKVNYDTLEFDTAADEFANFVRVLPASWNAGTVTAKFYWTAASGSGTVSFRLAGYSFGDNVALDTAFGTAQTATDTLLAAGNMHVSPATSAITIGGTPANGVPVIFQVSRDVTDTLGVDALLIGVEITFTPS